MLLQNSQLEFSKKTRLPQLVQLKSFMVRGALGVTRPSRIRSALARPGSLAAASYIARSASNRVQAAGRLRSRHPQLDLDPRQGVDLHIATVDPHVCGLSAQSMI